MLGRSNSEPAPVGEVLDENAPPVSLDSLTWHEYHNDKLGITISYPKELLETEFSMRPALSGTIFYGALRFPSGNMVLISSVTEDYTAEKDGSWGKGLGYARQGENYALKSLKGNLTTVSSLELWPINEGKDKALATYEKDFSVQIREEFYAPDLLVTVNLPRKAFPGLGFEVMQSNAQPITQEEIDALKKMITSILFAK